MAEQREIRAGFSQEDLRFETRSDVFSLAGGFQFFAAGMEFVKSEILRWGKVVEAAGIKESQ